MQFAAGTLLLMHQSHRGWMDAYVFGGPPSVARLPLIAVFERVKRGSNSH